MVNYPQRRLGDTALSKIEFSDAIGADAGDNKTPLRICDNVQERSRGKQECLLPWRQHKIGGTFLRTGKERFERVMGIHIDAPDRYIDSGDGLALGVHDSAANGLIFHQKKL